MDFEQVFLFLVISVLIATFIYFVFQDYKRLKMETDKRVSFMTNVENYLGEISFSLSCLRNEKHERCSDCIYFDECKGDSEDVISSNRYFYRNQ